MPTLESFYETRKAVSEYLLFHYGASELFLLDGKGPAEALDFPSRCAELALRHPIAHGRALDLGCAVGRAACEMSAYFEESIGVDFARSLIDAAQRMASGERMSVTVAEEGELIREVELTLPRRARPEHLRFVQGDALQLDPALGAFDFVLMANLVDRLPNPRACLEKIHDRIRPHGILAVTSPYTWLEEYTPKEKWLGGFSRDGEPVRSADTLAEILSPRFQLIESLNLPFLIREHARKFQYSVAHATLWRKR